MTTKRRRDPLHFIEKELRNPETGEPFKLYDEQRRFLKRILTLTRDGKLPYPEMVWSGPKKIGKTELAAFVAIVIAAFLGGPFAEVYCCANDLEQSQGRVFKACVHLVEACPMLRKSAKTTATRIEFDNGSFIAAIASDAAGAAGANPSLTVFDELWGYTSERATRLWDEMVPPPTRAVTGRLTVTYAGFTGESTLLESLYKQGLQGKEIAPDLYEQHGMLMFWTHRTIAPWQTPEWVEQMRRQLRASAFLRLIENRWVSSESSFVDIEWWDACVDANLRPVVSDNRLPVWCGVDASVKRDSSAVVGVTWDEDMKRPRLVRHRIFQPSPKDPLDFEATIERELLHWTRHFALKRVLFDPYQMVNSSQRLRRAGLPMHEFPQSTGNLTEASTTLYEVVKGRNLAVYPDAEIRLSVSRSIAVESTRGWRIAKEKASHKIDVVVALAQAVHAATKFHSKVAPLVAPQGIGYRPNPFAVGGSTNWN